MRIIPVSLSWSDRRDSNPRPRPWEGRILPTELLSLILFLNLEILLLQSNQSYTLFLPSKSVLSNSGDNGNLIGLLSLVDL